MKRLMTTTALVAALAMPAIAAETDTAAKGDHNSPWLEMQQADNANGTMPMTGQPDFRASTLIGMRVYSTEHDSMDEYRVQADASTEWNDIGEVNDILLSRDGELEAILLDIGGFLGIGEKPVAVKMSELRFVADGDNPGDFFIVFTANAEALENAPAFEVDRIGSWAAYEAETHDENATFRDTTQADARVKTEGADAEATAKVETENTENADTAAADAETEETVTAGTDPNAENGDQVVATTENAEGETVLMAPEVDREGYDTAEIAKLTASDVTGAVVYDINEDVVGEISDLVMATDGIIDQAIIDVGGFLGIGEKSVAVDMDSLTFKRGQTDGDLRVYVNATEASFDQMPEWQK